MPKSLLFIIIFLFSLTNFCYNEDPSLCKYQNDKNDMTGVEVNDAYFNKQDEGKDMEQICHSLSHTPVQKDKCCYDKIKKTCVTEKQGETLSSELYDCPRDTVVHNSCGMAGIYQPFNSLICTEISMVGGYCCFVKSKKNGVNTTSCLRTQKINKDKNSKTEQIQKYLEEFDAEFMEMTCKGTYAKILLSVNFILGLLYYF